MRSDLVVHTTADALDGAIRRAADVAKRYFGDRPARLVSTSAENHAASGFFTVRATFEEVDSGLVLCGAVGSGVCYRSQGHPGLHHDIAGARW